MTFHDSVVTGFARIGPLAMGSELRRVSWAHRAARLARMDRLCALALVAADMALVDAGAAPASWVDEAAGARVGVVVGTAFGCHATNEEYFRGVLAEGARGASPRLFAYTLPSSPLGEISIHYAARGPSQALASGRPAGIEAVARASALCASGRADLVIAVAVDTAGVSLGKMGLATADGAAAVVIERREAALGRGARPRGHVRAIGEAFEPGRLDAAVERATEHALALARLPSTTLSALPGRASDDAVAPVAALVDWWGAAQDGGRFALVVAGDPAGGACALIAERAESR